MKNMKIANVNGKKLSLVIWGKNKDGEDNVRVYLGIAVYEKNKLYLERDEDRVPILDEWLDRIKKTKDSEIKDILLGADYSLSLSIGNKPKDISPSEFIKLPIKWDNK